MIFKIIETLETELFRLACRSAHSKQFKSDLLDAVKAIRKIKKYF